MLKKYFGFFAVSLFAMLSVSTSAVAMYNFEDALDEKEFEAMLETIEGDIEEWEKEFDKEMGEFEDELEKALDELEGLLEYKIEAVIQGAMDYDAARGYIKDELYDALKSGDIDEEMFKKLLHEFDEEIHDFLEDQKEQYNTPKGDLPELEVDVEAERESIFTWTQPELDDFRYYKLVYSTHNKNPRYPHDKTMFISDNPDENEVAMWIKPGYWAICHAYEGFYASGEKDNSYVLCSPGMKLSAAGMERSDKKYAYDKYNKSYKSFDDADEELMFDDADEELMKKKRAMMRAEMDEKRKMLREERERMYEEMELEKEAFEEEMEEEFDRLKDQRKMMREQMKEERKMLREKWENFDIDDENFEFDFEPEEFEHIRHFGRDFNPRMFERVEDESFFDDFDPDFFNHTDIDEIPEDVFDKIDFGKFDRLEPELFERLQETVPERLESIPRKVLRKAEFMLDEVPEDLLEEFGFIGEEADKVKKLMKAVNKQKREEIANVLDDIDQAVREEMMDLQDEFETEVSGFMEYLPNVPEQAREKFVEHKKNFLERSKKMEERFASKKKDFDRTTEERLESFQDIVENYNFVGESAEELQDLIDEFLDEVEELTEEEIEETLRELHEELKELKEASKADKFAQGIIPFRDTDDDQWFTTFVSEAANNGVIGGYKDAAGKSLGEFRPANKVLISEAIKMAAASAGLEESDLDPSNEAAQDHWVAGWIRAAEDAGMSVDVTDVNAEATRGDVVRWAIESFGIIPPEAESSSFADVRTIDANLDYIEYAKEMGIISGDGDTGNFRPRDGIIRAEVAKILGAAAEAFAE